MIKIKLFVENCDSKIPFWGPKVVIGESSGGADAGVDIPYGQVCWRYRARVSSQPEVPEMDMRPDYQPKGNDPRIVLCGSCSCIHNTS